MANAALYPRPRLIKAGWIPAVIVLGLAGFNLLVWSIFAGGSPGEYLDVISIGALGFEPFLFAIWAALGPGRFAIRVPLIIPCLMLVVAATGLRTENFNNVQQLEFIVLLVAAVAIFLVTTTILLVFRWFVGWRIEKEAEWHSDIERQIQYDLKYMLLLVTLYSVSLGITCGLTFAPSESPSPFLGPEFLVSLAAFDSGFLSVLLLPLVGVPLAILAVRPSAIYVRRAVALWLVATIGALGILRVSEGATVADAAVFLLLMQLGASIVAVSAALPLRLAGYRLVKLPPAVLRERLPDLT
jgi:hypothetical protein